MSQNTPEFSRPQLRRLNKEYRKAGRQGAKDLKAAFAMARKNVKNMDPALREGIGRANLTSGDLSAMAQRSVSGVHSQNARAELGALGQAAQGRGTGPRSQPTSLVGMLSTAASRWSDLRRGTKMLKAAYAQAAKDAKTMDPMVRAQIGHSTMTRGDLSYLAQRNLTQALQSPGDFEVGPGQARLPSAQELRIPDESFAPRNQVDQRPGHQQSQRLDMLRGEIRQLREQIAGLEQQVAALEAAENQPQQTESPSAEAQQPETQAPEAQAPEAQSPEAQVADAQSAEAQSAEAQSPEAQAAESQSAEALSPEAQQAVSEQHVGQHEVVPADKAAAQQWAASASGERPQPPQQPAAQPLAAQQQGDQQSAQQPVGQQSTQQPGEAQQAEAQQPGGQQSTGSPQPAVQEPAQQAGQQEPRGTAQPVFQAAGEGPTTRPGQSERPPVPQPVFQAAGEQPNEAARKAEATRAAAAAFYGTADVRPSTPEQAAKTAQSDPNKADRSTGQTANQKNDPNGRGSR